MARLNIEKARQLGYSDDEIAGFLKQNPGLMGGGNSQVSQAKGNLLVNLLPLIGSLAGGALAAPLPGGIVWGSAIGSGIGESGRQLLTKEKPDWGKVGTEALLGAAGGYASKLLGAGRAAKTAGTVAKAGTKAGKVAKASKALKLTLGEETVAKPYTTQAYKTFSKQGGDVMTKVKGVGKTVNSLSGTTAPAKLNTLSAEKQAINEALETATQSKKAAQIKIPTMGVVASVDDELASRAVNIKAGAGKTAYTYWKPRIEKVESLKDLSQLHVDISAAETAAGGLKTREGRTLNAIRTGVMKQLNKLAGTEELMARMSSLKQAEPIIAKRAGDTSRVLGGVLETQIPQRVQELTQSGMGNAMKLAGKTLGTPMGRQVGGQVGARALLGGGEETTPATFEGYESELNTTSPTNSYQKSGFNITPEQVAMAYLTMPKKQADAIAAAYGVMNKGKASSASQEFVDKAVGTISSIKGSSKLGFGPVQGRAYDMDINVLGGASSPADVVALNQKYTMLRLNLLRAYQGARISDKDYELAGKYIPNLYDTDSTARTKLQILSQLLLSAVPPSESGTGYYQTD